MEVNFLVLNVKRQNYMTSKLLDIKNLSLDAVYNQICIPWVLGGIFEH